MRCSRLRRDMFTPSRGDSGASREGRLGLTVDYRVKLPVSRQWPCLKFWPRSTSRRLISTGSVTSEQQLCGIEVCSVKPSGQEPPIKPSSEASQPASIFTGVIAAAHLQELGKQSFKAELLS